MNNPFPSRIRPDSPKFALGAAALMLGILIGLAFVTNQQRDRAMGGRNVIAGYVAPASFDAIQQIENLNADIESLTKKLSAYENQEASEEDQKKLVEQSLRSYEISAGLTEMIGPGISITLADGKTNSTDPIDIQQSRVQAEDISRIINELWAASAEAIAVNDQRIVANTTISMDGDRLWINGELVQKPIRIRAIGEWSALESAMTLSGGVIEQLIGALGAESVKYEKIDKMTLPKSAQLPKRKFAKSPDEVAQKP